jgi:hypothetical protein
LRRLPRFIDPALLEADHAARTLTSLGSNRIGKKKQRKRRRRKKRLQIWKTKEDPRRKTVTFTLPVSYDYGNAADNEGIVN